MKYVVVSMYTVSTPYEQEVENLRASLVKFKVQHKIYPIENTGSWAKNCQQKAVVIRQAMEEFSCSVVWIDADAVLMANPSLFETLNCDLSYYYLRAFKELLSGTLWMANNRRMRTIVDHWIALNATNEEWDQKNLQKIVEGDQSLKKVILPVEYCKIDKIRFTNSANPVITHYQASRRFRDKMHEYL
jgi:hypothetical protein